MSGANARWVRVEFPDKRVRESFDPHPTLSQRERDLLVSGFALSSLLSPKNDPSERCKDDGPPLRSVFNRPHIDLDFDGLVAAAQCNAFDRSDVAVVAAPSQRDVAVGNHQVVGRIET